MAAMCREICKAFAESPLLQGKVERRDTVNRCPWKPDFEWLFKNDTNWVKVIEGKYDDKQNQSNTTETTSEVW